MLDQLVESKSNATENSRRGRFMVVTLVLAVAVVLGLWTKDLFAQNFGMDGDDLELSTLVAPPPPDEPPPPEPEKETPKKQQPQDADVRKELIQSMDMTPVKPPDVIKTDPSLVKAMRSDRRTILGNTDSNTGSVVERGGAVAEGSPTGVPSGDAVSEAGAPPPPPPPAAPKPTPKPAPKTVSGGVLNGKATSLPTPAYPAIAKAAGAKGSVSVQVLIDETGKVVSASAVSGHPMLRAAAVGAAQRARFSPTLLSGQAVKVSGVITYNFQ
jgi:periplasmic protein TonB